MAEEITPIIPDNENNISLSKTVYGKTNAKSILDEEFTEFLLQIKNYKEFFDLYDSFFYDIPKFIHESFIYESKNYLDYAFSTGNSKIVKDLEEQLFFIQEQIDRIEKHHPFYPNGSVIASSNIDDNRKYLLQSNRKRLIINTEIFNIIKTRLKINKPNSEFIIFIPEIGISNILDGPPIMKPEEIFVENKVINTYYG